MMEIKPLQTIDITELASSVTDVYKNIPLAITNDHVIRMGIMTEPYFWHMHPNSDETFLVMEGGIYIDLEDRTVPLLPGQLFSIPKGVMHRTRPIGARSVNLTVELTNMETVKKEDL